MIVDDPSLEKGRVHNDYGQGFYLSEHYDIAKEWSTSGSLDGFVNSYEFDIDNLSIFNLSSAGNTILNWLAVLVQNRIFELNENMKLNYDYLTKTFSVDISNYDVIMGYRADDSYFSMAKLFLSNGITLDQLKSGLYPDELGIQWCLKSRKAFEHIKFVSSESVPLEEYRQKRNERDIRARERFFTGLPLDGEGPELYMSMIRQEKMSNDDLRIQ